jgi:hypothetical protein
VSSNLTPSAIPAPACWITQGRRVIVREATIRTTLHNFAGRTNAETFVLASLLVAFSAEAQQIYGAAFTGPGTPATLYSINPTSGAATAIGLIGFTQVSGMDFSPTGQLFGVGVTGGVTTLIRIDLTTGAGTAIGPLGGGLGVAQDIAFRSDGTLFAYVAGDIYTINTTTGAATLVGNTGGFPDGNGIAFQGNTLYLANTGGTAPGTLWTVNTSTAALTPVATFTFGPGFTPASGDKTGAIKFDPASGRLFSAVIEGSGAGALRFLATIDVATGAVTDVGASVAGLDAIAILAAPASSGPVPTLSDAAMLLLAALMLLTGAMRVSRRAGKRL